MKLRVIEGGLGEAADQRETVASARRPSREDVRREAVRRLRESGYHSSYVREFATGVPAPEALRYLKMQLDFAAETLSRLDPIPHDFSADAYWPSADTSR